MFSIAQVSHAYGRDLLHGLPFLQFRDYEHFRGYAAHHINDRFINSIVALLLIPQGDWDEFKDGLTSLEFCHDDIKDAFSWQGYVILKSSENWISMHRIEERYIFETFCNPMFREALLEVPSIVTKPLNFDFLIEDGIPLMTGK